MTPPGQGGSYPPYMLFWNTPIRKLDTFRPMLGVQTSYAQCDPVMLSVSAPTTTQTRDEEIEQTYVSVSGYFILQTKIF